MAAQKKNDEPIEVEHKRSKRLEAILKSRNVDACNLLATNQHWDLLDALVRIEPDIPKVILKAVSIKHQYQSTSALLNNPLRGNYTLCIGSFPTDARAKQLAVMLMRNAILYGKNGRDYPLLHKVYGTFKDPLRDAKEPLPISMLVLTNITSESSLSKIEKLRDLLEMYAHIPKIVAIGGNLDPLSFFATKLHLQLTASIYLGSSNRIKLAT